VDIVYHWRQRWASARAWYEIKAYTSINSIGTAVLLERMINGPAQSAAARLRKQHGVYGEGLYEIHWAAR
jgi:dTDP-L-rhamnose 4-epimerase